MTENKDVNIKHKVDVAVSRLKKQGVEGVVIGVDENGHYAMNSNVGYATTAFLLQEGMEHLYEAIKAKRRDTEDT